MYVRTCFALALPISSRCDRMQLQNTVCKADVFWISHASFRVCVFVYAEVYAFKVTSL